VNAWGARAGRRPGSSLEDSAYASGLWTERRVYQEELCLSFLTRHRFKDAANFFHGSVWPFAVVVPQKMIVVVSQITI
jgi:hypothetical protein